MRHGIAGGSVVAFLLGCMIVCGSTSVAAGLAQEAFSPDRPVFRTYLLESAGSLGVGTGCAAVALPFTLLYYLFTPGDVGTVLGAEGLCLGVGCAAGACWTGRSLGSPTKFWPALGLALVPGVGAGLVMGLTRKGPDLTDPLVAGCTWAAVIATPVLATVGANLGRRDPAGETSSRFQVLPALRAYSSGSAPSAGLEFRLTL
jgi:hypothetical protein